MGVSEFYRLGFLDFEGKWRHSEHEHGIYPRLNTGLYSLPPRFNPFIDGEKRVQGLTIKPSLKTS